MYNHSVLWLPPNFTGEKNNFKGGGGGGGFAPLKPCVGHVDLHAELFNYPPLFSVWSISPPTILKKHCKPHYMLKERGELTSMCLLPGSSMKALTVSLELSTREG